MATSVHYKLASFIRALAKLDLLVIDELGYLPMGDTAGNHLFVVVSVAYERQSLIVTSTKKGVHFF